MLVTLLFSQIAKSANSLELFEKNLKDLRAKHAILHPGQSLSKRRLSYCLLFDDVSFHFYHSIYPIIKQLQIPVVLAIPVSYILSTTTIEIATRLSVPHALSMQEGIFERQAPNCTWEEIRQMLSSGLIHIASYGYLHCNLTFPFVNLDREILLSKQILEKELASPIHSFLYPFKKWTRSLQPQIQNHYHYIFGASSGFNFSWKSKAPLKITTSTHFPLTLPQKLPLLFKSFS